jgi:Cof subfamily protein (haloacid dehalogenase superfamily)
MSFSRDPRGIKALAMDLDGTILAPGAVLNDRTIKAIDACKKKGLQIIIATGRALEAAEPFRHALGACGPMIYFNGAMVVEMPDEHVLSAVPLNSEAAQFCVDLAREKGVYCQLYISDGNHSGRTTLMAERDCPEREAYLKHTRLLAELGDLKDALLRAGPGGCIKTMFLAEPEILSGLRPILEEGLGKSVYTARTLSTFLEVMDASVSKGQGLKYIMERFSLKRDEVIAFGDEENDLPMLATAGFAIVPSNAKDALKTKADLIIGSNIEDGVAVFLEEFFEISGE